VRILDFYSHQGHQYEFFKGDHTYTLLGSDNKCPNWNTLHRPKNKNVLFRSLEETSDMVFDIVMYRSSSDISVVNMHRKRGAKIIFVSQTTFCPEVRMDVDAIVWNSSKAMRDFSNKFNCRSEYIVHGYDPSEFKPISCKKNHRVLSLANAFKSRGNLLGYDVWSKVKSKTGICDVYGHNNEDIRSKRVETFDDQIKIYSKYSMYLNTTTHSAMPRSRAEAMMCGMPIITTKNYGIEKHVYDSECFYIKDEYQAISAINKLLSSESLQEEYSKKSRNAAIREFSLSGYLSKWNNLFEDIL